MSVITTLLTSFIGGISGGFIGPYAVKKLDKNNEYKGVIYERLCKIEVLCIEIKENYKARVSDVFDNQYCEWYVEKRCKINEEILKLLRNRFKINVIFSRYYRETANQCLSNLYNGYKCDAVCTGIIYDNIYSKGYSNNALSDIIRSCNDYAVCQGRISKKAIKKFNCII